jgi:hypothetical protein
MNNLLNIALLFLQVLLSNRKTKYLNLFIFQIALKTFSAVLESVIKTSAI